jgi:hypothetical protein
MFVVPATKATDPENRFEFEVDGTAHSAPLLEFISTKVAQAFSSARTHADQRTAYIVALADGDAEIEEKLLLLPGDALAGLVDAYDEASGITAGESDASTDS